MDDSNFDYEMDPSAAYADYHGSAEEIMDDARSEGMVMSDASLHPHMNEKSSIDVDFQDYSSKHAEDLPVQVEVEVLNADIQPSDVAFTNEHSEHHASEPQIVENVYTKDAIEEVQVPQDGVQFSDASYSKDGLVTHSENEAVVEYARDQDDAGEERVRTIDALKNGGEEEEDELHEEAEVAAPTEEVAVAATSAEEDQLENHADDALQEHDQLDGSVAAANAAEPADGYYGSDHQEAASVRVTFNGQDFVMWSHSDIPSYLALADKGTSIDATNEADDVVEVEAPALEVQHDILWQPLDALLAGLRERQALGDFLDESNELHLVFPDLDLDVSEDNLYCREITLEDLLQLHHGLGLPTSLHIQVHERPRFITKYNELAQRVAGIIGSQLQHSIDDSEEEEEAYHSSLRQNAGNTTGSAEEQASVTDDAASTKANIQRDLLEEHAGEAHEVSTEDPSSAFAHDIAPDHGDVAHLAQEGEEASPAEGCASEAVDELKDDAQEEGSGELDQGGLQSQHEDAADALGSRKESLFQEVQEGAGDSVTAANEEGVEAGEENLGEEEAAEWEEEALEAEGEYEESLGEEDEVDLEEDAQEGAEEDAEEDVGGAEGANDDLEAEVEDELAEEELYEEEYEDEAGDVGEDPEQTFYTTVNEDFEGEEDELEEPGHESAPANGNSAELATLHPPEALADEAEEQIVEYTEEPADDNLHVEAAASSYDSNVQRKRSLAEEEDDAQYGYDYEAESKRAKVD